MPGAHRVATVRAAEQASPDLGTGVLMARAAAAVAQQCLAELRAVRGRVYGAEVLVAVGPGNNGGDGLYAAARLAGRGARVWLWPTAEAVHSAGWQAALAAGCRPCDAPSAVARLASAHLVVDAVLGMGGRAGLPDDVAALAEACADLGVPVVSVDLPSGLAADAPSVPGTTFRATTTVACGALRPCHVLEPARSRCGRIVCATIGLELPPPDLAAWTVADVAAHLRRPSPTDDKYSRGVVGVDAGCAEYIGAGVLATLGAVLAGAGMVRFVGPKPGPVRLELPNVVAGEGRVQAWLVGSGWSSRADGQVLARRLSDGVPTVIDADALEPSLLPETLPDDVVLTPHAGELARLLDCGRADVEGDPVAAVTRAVERWGATVLLKGATQYVATPGAPVTLAVPGPGWTAQAGSGDVLAGVCAALLAAGLKGREAALCAASLQALAAARRPGPHPPQTVARVLPDVIAELTEL